MGCSAKVGVLHWSWGLSLSWANLHGILGYAASKELEVNFNGTSQNTGQSYANFVYENSCSTGKMTFQNHWSIMWLRGGKIPQALRVETSWVVPVDLPPADIVFQCSSGSRSLSPEELIAARLHPCWKEWRMGIRSGWWLWKLKRTIKIPSKSHPNADLPRLLLPWWKRRWKEWRNPRVLPPPFKRPFFFIHLPSAAAPVAGERDHREVALPQTPGSQICHWWKIVTGTSWMTLGLVSISFNSSKST